MEFTFNDIARSWLFEKTTNAILETSNLDVVERPACFAVCSKREDAKFVKRIIVFPPHGFTADDEFILNPHPEIRKARVNILGEINPTKKGFKPLVRNMRFSFSLSRSMPTEKGSAYARFSEKYCGSLLKSWRNWFHVVKEEGWGYFHNLINLSNRWVIAILEKHLVDRKVIDIQPYLRELSCPDQKTLLQFLCEIERHGDGILHDTVLIQETLKLPTNILVPILIQMLNLRENGRHQPCTAFAILLKIARGHRNAVVEEVGRAIELKLAPWYYINDLHRKLRAA